jgi:predicted DNA-binding antitoxin AbrB/MazE fold protein
MEKSLQAVYKHGVLLPLEPVPLVEQQQVTVTISDAAVVGQDVQGYFTPEEWSKAEEDDISLKQVRQALSTISGSLCEAVIALREER